MNVNLLAKVSMELKQLDCKDNDKKKKEVYSDMLFKMRAVLGLLEQQQRYLEELSVEANELENKKVVDDFHILAMQLNNEIDEVEGVLRALIKVKNS